jgi:uncharacterized RDD family membrane protein YckC/DNA-directed RNA polymerase subunit M/transcription elongation factor TFIIS
MPIKVRCGECQAVLNLPDAAAGKVAKCRKCGGRVRVPSGKSKSKSNGKSARSGSSRAAASEDALHGIDLRGIDDKTRRVCPGCATPVHLDDIECPKCGVTIATGALSERQRRRQERKGPPPEEFYGDVWGNAWKFLKKHWGYGVRTATVWTITLSLAVSCLYAWVWYIESRTEELTTEARQPGIEITGSWLVITPPKDGKITYDEKTYRSRDVLPSPRIAAIWSPPSYFWLGMSIVFQLGFGGWAWTLATKIAELTMAGEKKIKRFNVDFFGNLTMGFRFYFWPIVLMAPLTWIGPAIAGTGNELVGGIITAVTLTIPLLLFLPAAVVHMSQNYQYRAWLLTWMVRDFFSTIAATLYVAAMLFVLVLLIPVGAAAAIAATWPTLYPWLMSQEQSVLRWLTANLMDFGTGNARFLFYELPVVFGAAFCFFFVLCTITAFPAVFMMRVIGLFGVYFRADLALVNEFPDLEPAGFGPRYLAYLIDNMIMAIFFAVAGFVATLVSFMYDTYGVPEEYAIVATAIITSVGGLILSGLYFARGESGAARATLGKWSIGLIVLQEDDKPVPTKHGFKRAFMALLFAIPLYAGFLACAFRPDKRALHDIVTKTKVVWRGEER